MSSNKNISRRIKKEILNNDCDYDTLYNELLDTTISHSLSYLRMASTAKLISLIE